MLCEGAGCRAADPFHTIQTDENPLISVDRQDPRLRDGQHLTLDRETTTSRRDHR
jgi:hypothetical protein